MKKLLLLCLPIVVSTSIACNSEAKLTGKVNNAPVPTEVVPAAPTGSPDTTTDINQPSINPTNPEITGNGFGPDGTPIATPVQPINVDQTFNPIPNNPYVNQIGFADLGQPNQNPGQNAINGIRFTPNQNPVADITYESGKWVDPQGVEVPTNITGHDQFGNPIPGVTHYNGVWYDSKGNNVPGNNVTGYNKLGNPTFDIPYGSKGVDKGSKVGNTIPTSPNQNIPTSPSQNDCNSCTDNGSGLNPNQNSGFGFSPNQNSAK